MQASLEAGLSVAVLRSCSSRSPAAVGGALHIKVLLPLGLPDPWLQNVLEPLKDCSETGFVLLLGREAIVFGG